MDTTDLRNASAHTVIPNFDIAFSYHLSSLPKNQFLAISKLEDAITDIPTISNNDMTFSEQAINPRNQMMFRRWVMERQMDTLHKETGQAQGRPRYPRSRPLDKDVVKRMNLIYLD